MADQARRKVGRSPNRRSAIGGQARNGVADDGGELEWAFERDVVASAVNEVEDSMAEPGGKGETASEAPVMLPADNDHGQVQ
jgi:hypothetical protein